MTAELLLVEATSSHITFLEKLYENIHYTQHSRTVAIPIDTSMYGETVCFQFVHSIDMPAVIRPLSSHMSIMTLRIALLLDDSYAF